MLLCSVRHSLWTSPVFGDSRDGMSRVMPCCQRHWHRPGALRGAQSHPPSSSAPSHCCLLGIPCLFLLLGCTAPVLHRCFLLCAGSALCSSLLFLLFSSSFLCLCLSLSQAKVDNEILNYKDLAALPKIKAIYEVQRPDLISYEPYHRYTSDETLERYSYGEVLSVGTPNAGCAGSWAPIRGNRGKCSGNTAGRQEWG